MTDHNDKGQPSRVPEMGTERTTLGVCLQDDGDEIERTSRERLRSYIHRYEDIWLLLVEPLRASRSIMFRDGIDEDFEEFAMCHYTTYVCLARALDKIERQPEDLKYSEEIWSNLHRAAEVAVKAVGAFNEIHLACTTPRRKAKIDTVGLQKIEIVLKKYRNTLHDPVIGTAKLNGVRLVPRPDRLDHYHRWTTIMYHRRDDDFVPTEELLRSHFRSLTSALEGVWGEILHAGADLSGSREFLSRRAAGREPALASTANPFGASGTIILPNG
jgi:hypothetical protein